VQPVALDVTVLVAAIAELRVAIVAFLAGIDEGIAAIRVAKIGRHVWAAWQGKVWDERRRDVWNACHGNIWTTWQGNICDERRRNVRSTWRRNVWAGQRRQIRGNGGVGDRSSGGILTRVGQSGEREIRAATGESNACEKKQANAKPPIRRPHRHEILLYSG
jgi:hypothetical protein